MLTMEELKAKLKSAADHQQMLEEDFLERQRLRSQAERITPSYSEVTRKEKRRQNYNAGRIRRHHQARYAAACGVTKQRAPNYKLCWQPKAASYPADALSELQNMGADS